MTRREIRYDVPPGAATKPCKGCAAPLVWIKTPAGKPMPLNPDGVPHWATCPEAERFKKGKR